jgi:hypothetical protein
MTMLDFADVIGLRAAMEAEQDVSVAAVDEARAAEAPAAETPAAEAPTAEAPAAEAPAAEAPTVHEVPAAEARAAEAPTAKARAAEVPAAAAPIDEVRARLAARGLLQTQPSVVVPKAARRPEILPQAAAPADDRPKHWAAAPEDAWDVDASSASAKAPVACPRCRDVIDQPLEATRLVCRPCDRAWRWATCGGCDALTLTVERQESWRCAGCGQFTRSWWRTPAARRDALHVVARRKHQAMLQERERVRAGMRKRRWKLVAFAVVATAATAGAVLAVRAAEPSTATGTDVVCAHVARLGPALGEHIETELPKLEAEAAGAAPEVADAVHGLRAAGPPGSAAFLVARTALVDACTLVQGR